MSEKRQKKKIVKTPSCEPDIQVMAVKSSKLILLGESNYPEIKWSFWHFNDDDYNQVVLYTTNLADSWLLFRSRTNPIWRAEFLEPSSSFWMTRFTRCWVRTWSLHPRPTHPRNTAWPCHPKPWQVKRTGWSCGDFWITSDIWRVKWVSLSLCAVESDKQEHRVTSECVMKCEHGYGSVVFKCVLLQTLSRYNYPTG